MSLKKLKKYILFVYLTVLIIFIFCIIFFWVYMKQESEKNAILEQEEITEQYSEQIDNMLVNMDNIALLIMQDKMFLNEFEKVDQNLNENYFDSRLQEKFMLLETLQGFYTTNDAAERISVYNDKMDYLSYGILYERNEYVKTFLENTDVKEIIQRIDQAQYGKRLIEIEHDERGTNETLISVKRALMDIRTSNVFGVIDLQRDFSDIEEIFENSNNEKVICVLDEKDNVVYSTKEINDKTKDGLFQYIQKNDQSGIIRPTGSEEYFVTWSTGEKVGWTVIVGQPERIVLGMFKTISQYLIIFTIVFLSVNLLLVILVINKLMRPLQKLSDSVSEVNLDNMKLSLKENEKMDEISKINSEFQNMIQRLDISLQNEMRYHFEALQAQMNPHFLYNTLSVISAEAIQDNTEKIPELCEHLARMLRYTANYEKNTVTLKEELEYCKDYMSLMEERYKDKITYNIRISGEIEQVKIPKISIQPILENCFKHGFANKEFPWKIDIMAKSEGENWCVTVKDNGEGVQPEKLKQIIEKIEMEEPKKISGLGLINTIYRLRILYKEDVIYRIMSQTKDGFSVMFGGKNHD